MSNSTSTRQLLKNITSWLISLLSRTNRFVTRWSNHIESTYDIRKQYYKLLKQARQRFLCGQNDSDLMDLLNQIHNTREVYKRSAQLILDVFLITVILLSLVVIIHLVLPASCITIQLQIYSSEVELDNVLPTWSIDGENEPTQRILANRYITLNRYDSIFHEQSLIGSQGSTDNLPMRLAPVFKNGHVGLRKLNLKRSAAHIELHTENHWLNLSIRATNNQKLDTLGVKGELFASPILDDNGEEITVGDNKHIVDSRHPVNVIFDGKGMDQMDWMFVASSDTATRSDETSLDFYWQDIPVQQAVTFNKTESDKPVSTIQSGWVCILETNDTIRLGPNGFLDFHLVDNQTSTVDVRRLSSNAKTGQPAQLMTTLIGQVSKLDTGREIYHLDRMPTNIEIYAKTNSVIPLVGLLAWLLTILIPILFRSRL